LITTPTPTPKKEGDYHFYSNVHSDTNKRKENEGGDAQLSLLQRKGGRDRYAERRKRGETFIVTRETEVKKGKGKCL